MLLVGTNHLDLNGPQRLRKVLAAYKPRKISVEYDKGTRVSIGDVRRNLYYRRTSAESDRRTFLQQGLPPILIDFIEELNMTSGYEVYIPIEYAAQFNAKVYFVDLPTGSLRKRTEAPEASEKEVHDTPAEFSERQMSQDKDFREFFSSVIDRLYVQPDDAKARKLLIKLLPPLPLSRESHRQHPQELHENRVSFMEKEIRYIKPDIHIGGMRHIFGSRYRKRHGVAPLYQRIRDLSPERIRLMDADALPA